MTAHTDPCAVSRDPFAASRDRFEQLVGYLAGVEAGGLEHFGLEQNLQTIGQDLLCQLLQDHLDLRASRETRQDEVTDADGAVHRSLEAGHHRRLQTVFGQVEVERLAYRKKKTRACQ